MIIGRLVDLVLHAFRLLEAEGRLARAALAELVVAATVLAIAAATGVLACIAFAGALALALWEVMSPPVALGIVGGVLALLALLIATAGRWLAKPPPFR